MFEALYAPIYYSSAFPSRDAEENGGFALIRLADPEVTNAVELNDVVSNKACNIAIGPGFVPEFGLWCKERNEEKSSSFSSFSLVIK